MDVAEPERATSALTTPSSHFKGLGLPILLGEDVQSVTAHVSSSAI